MLFQLQQNDETYNFSSFHNSLKVDFLTKDNLLLFKSLTEISIFIWTTIFSFKHFKMILINLQCFQTFQAVKGTITNMWDFIGAQISGEKRILNLVN